ncbi:MAG: glycoside hydrolase family 16 protein [Acidobacteria bacterium]|nr:glycoside hydrolase family 16 protein [Acidobacteriota bacterium]
MPVKLFSPTWLRSILPSLLLIGWVSMLAAAQVPNKEAWVLTWSDEFDGARGSAPDASKWTLEIGTGGEGWGNHELEYYTARAENVHVENGNLVITARRENFTAPDGKIYAYTSARLKTQGKFSQKYGRFEARIKIPYGQGTWPAFWMLGDDIQKVDWPQCGEIDIMENIGSELQKVYSTLHGPGYSGPEAISAPYMLQGPGKFADQFHIFAVEWGQGKISFYVDGALVATQTPKNLPAGKRWVYDHPFFVLLNFAVGGDWPGSPAADTVFPQSLLVDYVRAYRHK